MRAANSSGVPGQGSTPCVERFCATSGNLSARLISLLSLSMMGLGVPPVVDSPNQVTTSNPEKILLMLYDGAINFTKIAIEKLAKGDVAGKGKYIGKTHAIVAELMETLNHEVGGDISRQLQRLYSYLIDELVSANIKNSPAHLENALKIMTTMRNTWAEAIDIAKREREGGTALPAARMG
mgnify:CR=1 FL=1